jgi:uncharacterized membrane protein
MESFTQIKDRACTSLTGKWGQFSIISFVYFFLTSAIANGLTKIFLAFGMSETASTGVSLLWYLVVIPLSYSYSIIFLKHVQEEQTNLGNLFDGFKDFTRVFLTVLLLDIYTVLWAILLIIPGIIKSYSYSMTCFIMKDDPTVAYDEAIVRSMKMMEGHKMDLFILDLSMIGWLILSFLTLGIGFLFLMPYNLTAHAHFYEQLKTETERQPVGEAL